ncbi:MAG TPA: universal stress protein [Acidimicrobiales bacterium]|nr:universal stress protein [Acidimicrobiales bacterium]
MARADRLRESAAGPERTSAGRIGNGPVDVLVGVDGSAESLAVLRFVVDVLDGRVGRLTVAEVIDYDTALDQTERPERTRATAALRGAALAAAGRTGIEPETVLLAGHPPDALARFAGDEGFGLVVIGGSGRGLSKALLGSTAQALSRNCPVPVFVVSNATSGEIAERTRGDATGLEAT